MTRFMTIMFAMFFVLTASAKIGGGQKSSTNNTTTYTATTATAPAMACQLNATASAPQSQDNNTETVTITMAKVTGYIQSISVGGDHSTVYVGPAKPGTGMALGSKKYIVNHAVGGAKGDLVTFKTDGTNAYDWFNVTETQRVQEEYYGEQTGHQVNSKVSRTISVLSGIAVLAGTIFGK